MAHKYSISVTAIVVAMMAAAVYCDIYMHNMRGSNNRLDEQNNNRDNANRLFDSQNNDNGGYNVGHMYYYGGSKMSIFFTAQHGSGIANLNNNFVLQYSCQEQLPGLRDGTTTTTIPDDADNSRSNQFGQHETYSYYQKCKTRSRNKGLYIANQNVGEKAIHTRQNNNGNRYGFECPEERDYYPYWHPTPWIDIAVMTTNTSMCGYYQSESQNVKAKNECTNPQYNNEAECTKNGATWSTVQPWGVAAPACLESCISRDNHLGNSPNGYPCKIDFDMPILQSGNCVLRLRYNISTNDYPPWGTFSDKNDQIRNQNGQTVQNPNPVILGVYPEATDTTKRSIRMQNNPDIDIGIGVNLQMNINTAQFFRTFEDRSHTFEIRRSPVSGTIWNLNVQGKRGNIVQVYPAVEYDFIPYNLRVKPGDYIHFQWTGTNNNNGGNAGQGRAGTDRNNIMVMDARGKNFPVHLVNQTTFGDYFDALTMAFSGMPGGVTNTLDAAGAYFDGGLVQMNNIGTFAMVSTRNNQFSNRSQKTILTVDYDGLSPGAIAGVTIGTTAGVGAAAAGGFALFKFRNKIPFLRGF